MTVMNVLVACEESQRVCVSFLERGHNAFSCDIREPSGGRPDRHIFGDALVALQGGRIVTMDDAVHDIDKWDLIIAHPPCTYLSNAGACRLYPRKGELNKDRYVRGLDAKSFFMEFYNANCERIAIENPIPSKIFEMPPYTQVIQPYWFGEPYSKKTCLWLKGLPELKPTNMVEEYKPYVSCGTSANKGNPDKAGVSRSGGAALVRSKTFWGIARAFAEQWG